MHRLLLRAAAVLVTLVVLLAPALGSLVEDGTATSDPVFITDHRAEYSVSRDGTLKATETITAQFGSGRHGIFRFWDVTDPDDHHVRYLPKDVAVTFDGQKVPVDYSWKNARRFRVAKIGDPDSTVSPGTHTYTIRYTVKGALSPVRESSGSSWGTSTDDASVFAWRIVAPGWQMSIAKSEETVTLPADPRDPTCVTDEGTECTVSQDGRTLSLATGRLIPPNTGVTLHAGLDLEHPDQVTLPWSAAWDTSLGRSVPLLVVSVLLGLVGLAVGYLWDRRSMETTPGTPVMFEPPAGLGPAQTVYVATESSPDRALSATILHLAEQKLVSLERSGDDWTITGLADQAAWDQADAVSRSVGQDLGVTHPGSTFAADGSVDSGQVLQSVKQSIPSTLKAWGRESETVVPAGTETVGRLLVVAALVLAGIMIFVLHVPATAYTLPFLGFVIGGAGLWSAGVGTRRTAAGRQIWSQAAGFRRLLTTDSAEARFDFSSRRELYTAFIPYAVAFDAADAWARKYEQSTGTAAPLPLWYAGGTSGSSGSFGTDVVSSFESSLSSSISAYAATQSSSSSGGGGFSGGGGGGGGGGGSW